MDLDKQFDREIERAEMISRRGLKIWSYTGLCYRYWCGEHPATHEVEVEKGDPCPECGFLTVEFKEVGL
jgi:hypothetical protein